jgi:hypothetical protein
MGDLIVLFIVVYPFFYIFKRVKVIQVEKMNDHYYNTRIINSYLS